jgi:hypothetical protein
MVVVAFFLLGLCVTAGGTARFAVALGYGETAGYAVGCVLELGKTVFLVMAMRLWDTRAYLLALAIGIAWLGLLAYSLLATHATVSTAIASRERMGTWHMETRSGTQSELAGIEQQLAALSVPQPPRPVLTVRQALVAEKVSTGAWRDSKECQSIRDSAHFRTACHKVLQLRRELAAAEDYERLSDKARALRQILEAAPIVAVSDPLPEAFEATFGRWLPIGGRAGVALLVTLVLEIVSSCGFAALRVLRSTPSLAGEAEVRAPLASDVAATPRRTGTRKPPAAEPCDEVTTGSGERRARRLAAARACSSRAVSPLHGVARPHEACSGHARSCDSTGLTVVGTTSSPSGDAAEGRPAAAREVPAQCRTTRSTKLPTGDEVTAIAASSPGSPRTRPKAFNNGGARRQQAPASGPGIRPIVCNDPAMRTVALAACCAPGRSSEAIGTCVYTCQVYAFIRERLERAEGASVSAAELRLACQFWCLALGHKPLSGHRLGAALRDLGFEKWKTNGCIRYRDLRLRA